MTDNLLDNKDTDVVEIDLDKNYLTELVGTDKKFKSPEELARGKYEADQYIEILKRRQDEMRADYIKIAEESKTRATLEDLLKNYSQRQTSNDEPEVKAERPTLDPKQIESLVSTQIQAHALSQRQEGNFNQVRDKLQERYGSNYKNVVSKQIEELGITEADLNEMARKQPKLLIRTLGLDREPQQDSFQSPPRTQRSDSFAPRGPQKRTWSYYQNLRKTNPEAWFDRKTAIQMQQDAIELGESFKDGDYNAYGGQ